MIMILVGWWARSESGCFCRQRPGLNFGIFVMVCSTFLPPPPPPPSFYGLKNLPSHYYRMKFNQKSCIYS